VLEAEAAEVVVDRAEVMEEDQEDHPTVTHYSSTYLEAVANGLSQLPSHQTTHFSPHQDPPLLEGELHHCLLKCMPSPPPLVLSPSPAVQPPLVPSPPAVVHHHHQLLHPHHPRHRHHCHHRSLPHHQVCNLL
jgi:hypothetical protein